MSLYNSLFGENENTNELLDILNLTKGEFGRFRDIDVNKDGTQIIVTTRCGGANREEYDEVFSRMRDHKYFIEDHDDNFDETYCYFTFKTPDIFIDQTKKMSTGKDPMTVSEKFDKEITEMQKPGSEAAKRAEKIAEQINKAVEENPDGGVILL